MKDRERGRDTGRGRSWLPTGILMWDSIPGPWDHGPNQKQTVNHSAQPPRHLRNAIFFNAQCSFFLKLNEMMKIMFINIFFKDLFTYVRERVGGAEGEDLKQTPC